MKRKTLRLATLLMAMMMFIALSVSAMAASSEAVTKNGITAQLFVDKDAYSLGDTVNAHVQVDNNTGKEVSVITKINVPEGVVLAGEDTFEGTLKDGESWSTLDDAKQTSGGIAAALPYMALAVLMSCGALAISAFGKKRTEVLSIVLCLAMLGGMVVSATPAEAADLSGSISLSCPITVAGVKSEVTAEVSYVIYGGGSDATVRVPEVKPTATPEAVPDMPEDPYNLIKNGSFEIKGAKTEYIFADWTAEAPSKTAADNTTPKFGLTSLKISNKTGRVSQMVDVEPGRTYELSGYIWMNGKVARMEVSGYSDLEGTQETDKVVILEMNTEKNKGSVNLTDENGESLTLPVSQTWNRFSYVFTAGKETEYVKVLLNTVGGFSLYDGVALRPIEAVATMDEPQPDHPGNLIVNGGFEALAESKEDDIFAGWKASDASKAHLSMDLKRYGCYSLRVSNKTALVTQMIDVEPKKTYKLSGYIYMYGTGARMFLAGYHDAEATIETLPMSTLEFNTTKIKGQLTFSNENGDNELLPTSNTWNKFTYTFTTDPLTEYVKLSLTGLSQSSFFDDLVLQPAEAEATMVEPEPEWEGNLIKNNGFENIAVRKNDDVFANWEITDFSKAFLEPDIKRFGYHSLRVSNKTARVTQRVDVEPGRTYQLAGYVYLKGNAARVIVGSYADYETKNETEPVKTLDINVTKNSPYLTFEHKKGIGVTKPLTQTWNRFYYTFTTGKNTEYIELVLTGLSSSSYFDAITLQKIPGYVATGAVANGDFEVTGDTADDIFVGWDETKEIESIDLKVTGYDDVGSAVQVAHEGGLDNCVEQMMDVLPNKGYDLTGYVYMTGESAAIDLTGYTDDTAQTEAGAATVIFATDGSSTEGLTFTDEDGNPVEDPAAETWYQFTYKLTTDANAEYMKMVLRGIQGATTFDNVCLNKSVWIPDTGLIVNGAFETAGDTDSADDIFAGWTEVAPAGKHTSLSTTGYDDVGTAFKTNSSSYAVSQKVEVEAGKTYELTGYIHLIPNASGGMKSYVFATSYTADDTALDNAISLTFQSTPSGVTLTDIDTNEAVTTMESGKWYQFSRKFTIAEDVKYIDLYMRGSGGTMTVDNICLHEAEPEPEADTGLIVDGGFEHFTGTDFDAWTEVGRTDRVYPADAQKYDGQSSLYINGSANSISQVVSVEPNTTYEMTGYIYLNRTGIKLNAYGYQDADKATATATKMVTQINDIANSSSSAGLTFTDPETGSAVNGPSTYKWYQFSYTLTTDADTKFIEVVLTGNGSAYVDNLSLFKAETEPGTTPTPTATPEVTPTPTAEPGTTPTPTAEPTASPEPTTSPEVPVTDTGLVVDGGFENFVDKDFDAWTEAGRADRVYPTNAQVYDGESVLYINGSGNKVSQMVSVEPGKTYELTGYIYLNRTGIKLSYNGYQDADKATATATKKAMQANAAGTASSAGLKFIDPETRSSLEGLTVADWSQFSYILTTDADTKFLEVVLEGNGSAYCDNVSLKEVTISLDQESLALETGNEATLTATISNASDVVEKAITWESDNDAVATVDANGKVTAVGKGQATITAKATSHGNITASCTVTVTAPSPERILNGGFETFVDKDFDAWTEAGRADRVYPTNAQVHDGESSLYINGSGNKVSQIVSVEPGKTYELTGYVYLNRTGIKLSYYGYQDAEKATVTATKKTMQANAAGTASSAGLSFADLAGNPLEGLTVGGWSQFSYTVTTTADTKFLEVVLEGNGSAYCDNVSLKEVETEPVATPTPSAVPTAEPTVPPTEAPTATPEVTPAPTEEPTVPPTEEPTVPPTEEPTAEPTATPEVTPVPTEEPTVPPTEEPTVPPTEAPTATPEETPAPTEEPTVPPTEEPTVPPTEAPTATPEVTPVPTEEPTAEPTATPEVTPVPTEEPTATPEPTPTPVISLIANGGFENGTGGLEGWTQAGNANYAKPRGLAAYEGTYGLYLKGQGNNVSQTVDVEPGKTYELTGYVHVLEASNTGKGKIILSYSGLQEDGVTPTLTTKAMYHDPNEMNPAITYTDLETGEPAALTHGKWYQFSCVVTTDADTEYLNVVFAGYNEGYYDNISLCEVIDPNLIKNGGFETVTDKDFDVWTENFGNEALAGSTADVVHDGSYALYINNGANSISQMVEVEPGETYELTGYIYLNRKGLKLNYYGYQDADKATATATKKTMELNDVASKASSAGLTFTDLETGTPVDGPAVLKWYKFSCKVTADADTKFLDLVLMGNGSGYYDNISLLKETATQ